MPGFQRIEKQRSIGPEQWVRLRFLLCVLAAMGIALYTALLRGLSWETRVQAKLYFRDFYGNPESITISVRLDVSEFEKIYLPIESRPLDNWED